MRSLGVVSAALWNSEQSRFAGMLTVSDIIHLIQYYYRTATYETAAADVETVRLEDLRRKQYYVELSLSPSHRMTEEIEKTLGVKPVPLIHEHPMSSIYDAARKLIETHARRLPLLDNDTETGQEVIVSVLTQYRLLKFISINVSSLLVTLMYLLTMKISASKMSHIFTCLYVNSALVHMSPHHSVLLFNHQSTDRTPKRPTKIHSILLRPQL